MTTLHSIGAIIYNLDGTHILLVEQPFKKHHGKTNGTYWDTPCGSIEHDEQGNSIPALAREIMEEAGLKMLNATGHAYTVCKHDPKDDFRLNVTMMTVSVDESTAPKPQDPDQHILDAQWFPLDEAKALIALHPDRSRREPLLEYLNAPNGLIPRDWSYEMDENRQLQRVGKEISTFSY
jgi:8-oxo-dGTP pyrophosphatase MutT (NUDIX family)